MRVLVGHSMAGGEMTTVGRQHSDRISGLVYLDALGDLEDEPPADPEWAALAKRVPQDLRPSPVCGPEDRRTFAAFRLWTACRHGFVAPLPVELPALRPSDRYPDNHADRMAVDAFVAQGRVLANRRIDKMKRHVADVRVVDFPGAGHYVFLTREADVLREIRTFVASLRR